MEPDSKPCRVAVPHLLLILGVLGLAVILGAIAFLCIRPGYLDQPSLPGESCPSSTNRGPRDVRWAAIVLHSGLVPEGAVCDVPASVGDDERWLLAARAVTGGQVVYIDDILALVGNPDEVQKRPDDPILGVSEFYKYGELSLATDQRIVVGLEAPAKWFREDLRKQAEAQPPDALKQAMANPSPLLDYLPAVPGSVYEYRGTWNERTEVRILRLQSRKVGDVTWHYFVPDESIGVAGSMLPGRFPYPGAFAKSNQGGVVVGFAFSAEDIDKITTDRVGAFLVYPLRIGFETKGPYVPGFLTYTAVVEGFESVSVPAGTFKGCAKMRMTIHSTEAGSEAQGEDVFWLAPGVGIVKWHLATGRTEEMIAYSVGEQLREPRQN